MNILDFQKRKENGKKITLVTCYDYWSAKIIAASNVDCILVGDSLAMVMHGHKTTIPATVELMALHTQAVVRGAENKFIITDLPFLAHRKGLISAMQAIEQLMQAGAQAIKIEGADGNEELIKHVVTSGIPVMGHLGMTPQSVHQFGGFHVQANQTSTAENLIKHAKMLAQAGCFAIVLECVPADLAQSVALQLSIPIIGIGAGAGVDGQVLVFHDLLGMDPSFKPKFLKHFFSGFAAIQTALNDYDNEVKQQHYPAKEHCY